MKALTFITTTLVVSAAGIAVGMLFAPKKGSKTRRNISRKSHQYSDYVSDKLDGIMESGSDLIDNFEEKTEQLADKAKTTAKKVEAKVNSK